MKPDDLKRLIDSKRRWTAPLSPEEQAAGFKGWYASKALPHFDSAGVRQYITYRSADSLPAARRHEWEAFMASEDELEKQRKLEKYLDLGYGACHLRNSGIADLVQSTLWFYDGIRYRLLAWAVMPNHIHVLWRWSSARFRSKKDFSGRTLTHPGAERVPAWPL